MCQNLYLETQVRKRTQERKDRVKGLAQIEIRCREHEAYLPACPTCRFLRRIEQNLQSLKHRRAHLFPELTERLATGHLIIIDLH